MKRVLAETSILFLILAGFAFLLYPTVSNWLAERNSVSMAQVYVEDVNAMTVEEIEKEIEKAKKYNDMLSGANIEDPFVPGSGMVLPENYTSVLDFGNGMMGYIEIPEIGVLLPIYHGTSESVLKRGVGHMENTALPIGGEGNHTVLTGHTGLPSAKLFTDLDQLEIGDVFYTIVLNERFAYEIDQILVIEPDDTKTLQPVTGEDYVTLITCTPYGINSHRLLVRGIRIPYAEEEKEDMAMGLVRTVNWQIIMIVSFVIFLTAASVVYRIINRRRQQRNDAKQGEG